MSACSATANGKDEPSVVPVAFRLNEEPGAIDIGGHNFAKSKKLREVRPPWRARGFEVRGRAEVFEEGGKGIDAGFDAQAVRVFPERIVGWGVGSDTFGPSSRSVGDAARKS